MTDQCEFNNFVASFCQHHCIWAASPRGLQVTSKRTKLQSAFCCFFFWFFFVGEGCGVRVDSLANMLVVLLAQVSESDLP